MYCICDANVQSLDYRREIIRKDYETAQDEIIVHRLNYFKYKDNDLDICSCYLVYLRSL